MSDWERGCSLSAESLPSLDGSSPLQDAVEQRIVHGLLTSLYASSPEERSRRTHGILNYVRTHSVEPDGRAPPTETALPAARLLRPLEPADAGRRSIPGRRWIQIVLRRVVLPVGLAASIVLAVVHLWESTPAAHAETPLVRAINAGIVMFFYLGNADFRLDDDPQAAEAFRQQLAVLAQKRDSLLQEFNQPGSNDPNHLIPLMQVWQGLATGLVQLGDREALRELQDALALLRANQVVDASANWQWILLNDLGTACAMFGEHGAAQAAYADSLDLRVAHGGRQDDPRRGDPGYEGHLAGDVVIPYLRFVMLALAQNDQSEADRWLACAEQCLAQQLRTICEMNASNAAPDASFWQAWQALPEEFRGPRDEYNPAEIEHWPRAWKTYGPSETYAHHVGAVLFHRAVVSHLKGDTGAAAEALDRLATLEPFLAHRPQNDEFRLPLLLHVERARLALLTGRPAEALAELDRAEAYADRVQRLYAAIESGQQRGPGVPAANRLPISPAGRVEIELLRAFAEFELADPKQAMPSPGPAGMVPATSPTRGTAQSRILRALDIPQRLVRSWPGADQARFLKQFEAWNRLANSTEAQQP